MKHYKIASFPIVLTKQKSLVLRENLGNLVNTYFHYPRSNGDIFRKMKRVSNARFHSAIKAAVTVEGISWISVVPVQGRNYITRWDGTKKTPIDTR